MIGVDQGLLLIENSHNFRTQNRTVPSALSRPGATAMRESCRQRTCLFHSGSSGSLVLKGLGNVNFKSESPARHWAAGEECRKTRLAARLAPPTSLPQSHAGNFLFMLLDFIRCAQGPCRWSIANCHLLYMKYTLP